MSLVDTFWSDSTPHERRLLLDEAAGRTSGAVEFSFDVFDVMLDFGAGSATVTDVLSADHSETTRLAAFLETAASFGDDPSIGDGLTEMERRPPTFEADAHGTIQRRSEPGGGSS